MPTAVEVARNKHFPPVTFLEKLRSLGRGESIHEPKGATIGVDSSAQLNAVIQQETTGDGITAFGVRAIANILFSKVKW
jgi:hypothetical protein